MMSGNGLRGTGCEAFGGILLAFRKQKTKETGEISGTASKNVTNIQIT